MAVNPPLSLLNDDVSLSQQSAPLSYRLPPPPPQQSSRTPSFSSSASSLSVSPSSFVASPTGSPFHHLLPSYAVPFSWERQPGIPKLIAAADASGDGSAQETHFLPLPPPLSSSASFSRKKRSDAGDFDPFAAALAQCAKDATLDSGEDLDCLWLRRSAVKSVGIWRRATVANRIGLLGFYGSCKTTCSVADSTIVVPRAARRVAGSYGRTNRRSE